MNEIFMQVEKAVDNEIMRHNALRHQIQYIKDRVNIQELKPATGILREKQLECLSFAKEIIQKLEKEGFQPFLTGNSLLGAVRHGGFIPWEGNMKFALMNEDFWQLEKYLQNNFVWIDSAKIKKDIQESDTFAQHDFNYFEALEDVMVAHNKEKGENSENIFAMRTPFDISLYKGNSLEGMIKIEFRPFYYVQDKDEHNIKKIYHDFANTTKNLLKKAENYGFIFQMYDELLKNCDFICHESETICAGINNVQFISENSIKDTAIFPKDSFFPLQKIAFEGVYFNSINNPHYYLSGTYLNYNNYPASLGLSNFYIKLNTWLKTKKRRLPFMEATLLP